MRLIDADALIAYIDAQKGRPFIGCTIGEALKIMTDEQPTIEPEQRWIPCGERLPRPNEEDGRGFIKAYLVQDARWMDVARWDGGSWIAWGYGTRLENVTAWMPLPAPWKGK